MIDKLFGNTSDAFNNLVPYGLGIATFGGLYVWDPLYAATIASWVTLNSWMGLSWRGFIAEIIQEKKHQKWVNETQGFRYY